MTDKQIICGRGSAKIYTTLNTIEVMLENEKLKETLKAKEQECERLKVELNTKKTMMDGMMKCSRYTVEQLNSIIDQLKAENEELKKVSCKFKDYCTCDTEKLKQTLTEIKEIAETCNYKNILDLIERKDYET